MFILFDSNVWISQLGLQSENGAAVRYFARMRGATVVIPEVVRLEVEERLTEHLLDLRMQVEGGYNQLLPVLGKLPSLHLPSEEDIRKTVKNVIPDLDVPIREIPFSEDAARSSMMKLLHRIPPSARTEQFRDGVIWAHCLELLDEGDVYLVSEDKDFYQGRNYEHGLASRLAREMRQRSEIRQVNLVRDLPRLLQDIRIPTEIDIALLFKSIKAQEHKRIQELLTPNGFELCGCVKGEAECFATEEAKKAYLTFSFVHPCQDSTGAGRQKGELVLKGSGFFNQDTKTVIEAKLSKISLDYPDWEPGGPPKGTVFVSAHFNAPRVHCIRYPLDDLKLNNADL